MKNLTNKITAENQTLLNNLDAQVKLLGLTKGNAAYKCIADALENNRNWLRPATTSGRGVYTYTQDLSVQVMELLDKMRIGYLLTNTSPKGGRVGMLITFTND